MKSSVIIKGNKYGFQLVLNPDLPFEELLAHVAEKFQESSAFFGKGRIVAVSFEGRELSQEEQNLLVETIVTNSDLKVSYIIDGAKAVENTFEKAIETAEESSEKKVMEEETKKPEVEEKKPEEKKPEEKKETKVNPQALPHAEKNASLFDFMNRKAEAAQEAKEEKAGSYHMGTLRSGQSIEVNGSLVVLGDVNPGAQIVAGGSVVILGCLKGTVTAGYPDDTNAFVSALTMDPMQIKIGNIIARAPDQKNFLKMKRKTKKNQPEFEPKLAFVENDNIFIEVVTRSLISELSNGQIK